MVQYIESLQNPSFKNWKKLLTAKGRKKQQKYLIEGFHLVEEAQKNNLLQLCITTQEQYNQYSNFLENVETYIVSDKIIKELSTTITSQNIFGIVAIQNSTISDHIKGKFIILDSLQDPGNVGTIIRTADAAGFDGIIVGDNCVDIYNDKTIRSMQGSQFHINIYHHNIENLIPIMKKNNITILGTNLNKNSKSFNTLDNLTNVAIIVGNEGNGVSTNILNLCDETIYIPIIGKAESLNVAIAASILMYKFVK